LVWLQGRQGSELQVMVAKPRQMIVQKKRNLLGKIVRGKIYHKGSLLDSLSQWLWQVTSLVSTSLPSMATLAL
jgi:hypothetical protein